MQVQPHLFFDGGCEEAAEFYRRTLGAEVVMSMRFKDGPDCQQPGMVPPGAEDKVMHMCLRVGDTTFMASDGRCLGQPNFQGFSLSLTVPNEAEAERLFASLGDGGSGADAIGQDLLFPAFRHGRRPLRRIMDGLRRALRSVQSPAGVQQSDPVGGAGCQPGGT